MVYQIDSTHDPLLESWVSSANEPNTDFPIQNLPFGRFRPVNGKDRWVIGVAIGNQVLDLRAAGLIEGDDMNALMSATPEARRALRVQLSEGLCEKSPMRLAWAKHLIAQSDCEYTLPCTVGDYTDFYTSVHHATTVGKKFRPDNPLLPNYKWVPIGYHGRSSSLGVSGGAINRPRGQVKNQNEASPTLELSSRLDYELELGWFVGLGNALGDPIGIEQAEAHLFGVSLFNDWSARDIQGWEYQPLGPFLSKNFASTLSPWMVTMEALAPFRAPFERSADDPQPLPYLDSPANRAQGALSIQLEVLLQTARMREAGREPDRLSLTNTTRACYWTPAQLVTHHTANGCNLRPGDLLGSGTLSGPEVSEAGSLMELTANGERPIELSNGERRKFLEDGDSLILRGWCEHPHARRIGFGECVGTVISR